MAAAKQEIAIFQRILDINQCIFASMLARYKISAAFLTFLGSGMSMALVRLLQDETGSGKPKMATTEMELVICQLLDKIETKFRRLDLHFRGAAFEWDEFKYCPTKPEVDNPIWQPQKPEILISQLLDEIETKFRRLDLHFRGAAFEWDEFKYCPTKPEV